MQINNPHRFDFLCKVALVGDQFVGKSSIISQFSSNYFSSIYNKTQKLDLKIEIKQVDGIRVKLQIWDFPIDQNNQIVLQSCYKTMHGFLLIFDKTNKKSFEYLIQKLVHIRSYIPQNTPIFLIGNKSDLVQNIEINNQQINDYALQNNITYIETSAKQKLNVEDTFKKLCLKMIQNKRYQEGFIPVVRLLPPFRPIVAHRPFYKRFSENIRNNRLEIIVTACMLALIIIVLLMSH